MKNRIILALSIIIVIMLGYIVHINMYKKEDVNKDGEVNALDLLKVQKYILKEQEKESEKNGIYKDNMGK